MNAELFAAVENPRFSADLNVVSGYKQFLRALESSAEGLALLEGVKTGEDSLEILFRVVSLVDAPVDPQYENLHDVALAAYLWVLSRTDPVIADTAAELVLECSGCWWARKVAEHLMTSRKAKRKGLAVSRDNCFVLAGIMVVLACLLLVGLALQPAFERASEQRRRHGYEAGRAGLPVEACPYSSWSTNEYREWKQGWIQGAMEKETNRVE